MKLRTLTRPECEEAIRTLQRAVGFSFCRADRILAQERLSDMMFYLDHMPTFVAVEPAERDL